MFIHFLLDKKKKCWQSIFLKSFCCGDVFDEELSQLILPTRFCLHSLANFVSSSWKIIARPLHSRLLVCIPSLCCHWLLFWFSRIVWSSHRKMYLSIQHYPFHAPVLDRHIRLKSINAAVAAWRLKSKPWLASIVWSFDLRLSLHWRCALTWSTGGKA